MVWGGMVRVKVQTQSHLRKYIAEHDLYCNYVKLQRVGHTLATTPTPTQISF